MEKAQDDLTAEEYYEKLKGKIRDLYPEGISEERCEAATQNFIGFGNLLLKMKREKEQKEKL